MDKPEALRLADVIMGTPCWADLGAAAAELRRLHALNGELLEAIKEMIEAEQSEGKATDGFIPKAATREHQRRVLLAWQAVHAAIAKAEGEQT